MYFNRNGEPISMMEWVKLHGDEEYCRVMWTDLDNGFFVSTIWLGLDHSFLGPPVFFETMVFERQRGFQRVLDMSHAPGWPLPKKKLLFPNNSRELDQARYGSEEEAIAGHQRMVAMWHHVKPKKDPWCPAIRNHRHVPRKLKKRLKKNPAMWKRYFPDKPLETA